MGFVRSQHRLPGRLNRRVPADLSQEVGPARSRLESGRDPLVPNEVVAQPSGTGGGTDHRSARTSPDEATLAQIQHRRSRVFTRIRPSHHRICVNLIIESIALFGGDAMDERMANLI